MIMEVVSSSQFLVEVGIDGRVVVATSRFLNSNTSMTLISDTFTASSTPSKARIVVFAEITDDLNTDISVSVL